MVISSNFYGPETKIAFALKRFEIQADDVDLFFGDGPSCSYGPSAAQRESYWSSSPDMDDGVEGEKGGEEEEREEVDLFETGEIPRGPSALMFAISEEGVSDDKSPEEQADGKTFTELSNV